MKNKSLSGKSFILALMLVGFGVAVYALAVPPLQDSGTQNAQAQGIGYAVLTYDGTNVRWDEGGAVTPRTRPLSTVYREMGGKQRASLVNLLNQIGEKDWDLIQIIDNNYYFKRYN